MIQEAMCFALKAHSGQVRKSGIPYISHPFEVALELAKNGADDVLISAGLLHDVIEDAHVTEKELLDTFGAEITELVKMDSELKTLPWEERKEENLRVLSSPDSPKAYKMLMCADKLANLKSIEFDMRTKGEDVWGEFKRGRNKQEWYYRSLVAAMSSLDGLPMYEELKQLVDRIFKKDREGTDMDIEISKDSEVSVITIRDNLTTDTAGEADSAISAVEIGQGGLVIDIRDVPYISSAGLRVLLAAKKRCGSAPFRIINANTEVMKIFEITGFTEIMDILPVVREVSVEGCERIGAGACGECFRLDDETIIKLYYPRVSRKEIECEKALAKKAFVMGVPTAISYDIVESEGRAGVVYELIKSKTLSELIREDGEHLEKYVDLYADVCKKIHSISASDAGLPTFKDINRADIPNVSGVTDEERNYLERFLDLVPEGSACIHGDLNLNNIMVQNGECCLIDMGEFSTGIPEFDISRILFSIRFAADETAEINDFYKLPRKTCDKMFGMFLQRYYDCPTLEEAAENDPTVKWLYPLAWFRCATSMLKGTRWPEKKRELALKLLREKLIPFVDEQEKRQ